MRTSKAERERLRGLLAKDTPSGLEALKIAATRALPGLLDDLAEAEDVAIQLSEDSDCALDHHGYCQAHGWLQEGPCPNAKARAYLRERKQPPPATEGRA